MKTGDTIVIESKKAFQTGRAGVIEQVIQENPARVLVRWEDGHTSILAPAAGVARIVPATAKPRSKAKPKPKSAAAAGSKAKPRAPRRKAP